MGCLSKAVGLAVLAGAGVWAYARYRDQLPTPVRQAAGAVGLAAESLARNSARSAVNSAVRTADELSGKVRGNLGSNDSSSGNASRSNAAAPRVPIAWASVNAAANSDAIASLTATSGPAYVTVGAGDLASMLAVPLRSQLPRSAADVQIALVEQQLLVRGVIDVGEIAGDGTVGKLLGIAMAGRDTLQFGGSVDPLRTGFAQYRVESLRVKGFDVPERVIPLIMRALRRSNTDSTLADNAFAVRLPRAVADLRINNGRMTLYKAVPPATDARRTPR